jgi:hypothetical protein
MGDPELRSDESILLRTQGIFVKSIPFEGILTNKRIILIDRTTNLLPQKEIALVTLNDFQAGENAIRDQIITLFIVTKAGETRQMILTFSRQSGGNRIRERDEWLRILKENTSSSFVQVIRKVIPGPRQAPKKTSRVTSPRIEVIRSPVSHVPDAEKKASKQERETIVPVKKIIKTVQESSSRSPAVKESESSQPGFGIYCSRCGNRVTEGSRFCNRCGTPIILPGSMAASPSQVAAVPQQDNPETAPGKIKPIHEEIHSPPRIESSAYTILSDQLPYEVPQELHDEPGIPAEQEPAVPFEETITPGSDLIIPETDRKPKPAPAVYIPSQNSGSAPPADKSPGPKKNGDRWNLKPGKKAILGIIAIVIIIAVVSGGILLYPMISKGGTSSADSTAPATVATTPKPSGTFVIPTETPELIIPAEGLYVHINYLGGWNGTYGMPSEIKRVTNSGNRFYLVENATGMVQASFEKLDGSTKHDLTVEIIKDGRVLKSGNNSTAFGKVTLSADSS